MRPLETLRRLQARPGLRAAHRILARVGRRLAFAVENLALAVLVLAVLSFLITRADWNGVTWEWGRFWLHYAEASPSARRPIDFALLAALAITTGLLGWARYRTALESWRLKEWEVV